MIWEGFERELFLQIINHSSLFSSMKESIKNDKVVTKKYLVYFLHPQPLGSILLLIFEADWFQEFSSMRTLFVWNFIQFTCFYVCEWEREREREYFFKKYGLHKQLVLPLRMKSISIEWAHNVQVSSSTIEDGIYKHWVITQCTLWGGSNTPFEPKIDEHFLPTPPPKPKPQKGYLKNN
jgi:hypothetical protein